MLPKSKRLTRTDFVSLPHKGILVHGEFFSVKVFAHTRLPSAGPQKAVLCVPSKYAVVVSAKVAKRSVDRHLVKRRAMEAIKSLPVLPAGSWCVLYAKAPAVTASYKDIRADITALLQRSRVLQ